MYGRRQGRRLRLGRQRLLAERLPELCIDLPSAGRRLDPHGLFQPRPASVWLEIGFGAGEHLAWQAQTRPDLGFIGCEPYLNGIAGLLALIERHGIVNIRIFPDDARTLLDALDDRSLDRAIVLFPDPWPKKRHAYRRFIGPETLDVLARVMRCGAELRVASDDMGYIRWTLRHATAHPAFEWLACGPWDWRRRPADWPATRYESKAIRDGRNCVYLRFQRRGDQSPCDRPANGLVSSNTQDETGWQ